VFSFGFAVFVFFSAAVPVAVSSHPFDEQCHCPLVAVGLSGVGSTVPGVRFGPVAVAIVAADTTGESERRRDTRSCEHRPSRLALVLRLHCYLSTLFCVLLLIKSFVLIKPVSGASATPRIYNGYSLENRSAEQTQLPAASTRR
jgi:hypothetical protein